MMSASGGAQSKACFCVRRGSPLRWLGIHLEGRSAVGTDEARRQYRIGMFNRRVARALENGNRDHGAAALHELRLGEFLCACGREGCDEIVVVPLEDYRDVAESPHRFVVALGHGVADVDTVIRVEPDYEVVEVKPEHRHPWPAPGDEQSGQP